MSELARNFEVESSGKDVIEDTAQKMKRRGQTCMADQNPPGNDDSVTRNVEKAKTPEKKLKRGADWEISTAYLSSLDEASPKLRPRKPVLSFRKVSLHESDYSRIVGRRVKVYWPIPRRWYLGHVNSFDNVNKVHEIVYDDGDKEVLSLLQEHFELEVMPDEIFGDSVKNAPESAKKKRALEVGETAEHDSGNLSTAESDKRYGIQYKATHKGSKKERAIILQEQFELEVMPDDFFEDSIKNAPESARKKIALEVGEMVKHDSGNLSTAESDKRYGIQYKETHQGSKKEMANLKNDAKMVKIDENVMDADVNARSEHDDEGVMSKDFGEKNPACTIVTVAREVDAHSNNDEGFGEKNPVCTIVTATKEVDVCSKNDEEKILSKGNSEKIITSRDASDAKELDVHESLLKLPNKVHETSLDDKALEPDCYTVVGKPEISTEENQKVVEHEVIGHTTKEQNLRERSTAEGLSIIDTPLADDLIEKVKCQSELLSGKLDPSGWVNVLKQPLNDETIKEIGGGN